MASDPMIALSINGLTTSGDQEGLRDLLRQALDIPRRQWVLVHGQHDSGTIEGVFGPYTEEHADWLLGSMLNATYGNWTKARLSSGPESSEPKNT